MNWKVLYLDPAVGEHPELRPLKRRAIDLQVNSGA